MLPVIQSIKTIVPPTLIPAARMVPAMTGASFRTETWSVISSRKFALIFSGVRQVIS